MHMPRFFRNFRINNSLQGREVVLLIEILQQASVVWGLEPGDTWMGQVKSGTVGQLESNVLLGLFFLGYVQGFQGIRQ